jgi:hypothetical protein
LFLHFLIFWRIFATPHAAWKPFLRGFLSRENEKKWAAESSTGILVGLFGPKAFLLFSVLDGQGGVWISV